MECPLGAPEGSSENVVLDEAALAQALAAELPAGSQGAVDVSDDSQACG